MARIAELIERDGTACVWCGGEPWRSDLTLEHLLPRARRGETVAENLVVACRRCNRTRGTRAVSAYVRTLLADGATPRLDILRRALERLAGSERRVHAEYGARQRELIDRAAPASPVR